MRKRADFASSGKLLIQTYAKPGHRYQYMPWASRMPAGVFKGMVISGVTRLARTCTLFSQFEFQRNLFMLRLHARGAPLHELQKWSQSVDWLATKQRLSNTNRSRAPPGGKDAMLYTSAPLHLALPHDALTAAAVPNGIMAQLGEVLGKLGYPEVGARHLLCWRKGRTLGSLLKVAADRPPPLLDEN